MATLSLNRGGGSFTGRPRTASGGVLARVRGALFGLVFGIAGGVACAPGVATQNNDRDASSSGGRSSTATGGSTGSGSGGGPGSTGGAPIGTGGQPAGSGGMTSSSGGDASGSGGNNVTPSGGSSGTGGSSGGRTGTGGAAAGTGGIGGGTIGGRPGTGGRAAIGGSGPAGGSGGAVPIGQPKVFSQCRFHFGTLDSRARTNSALKAEIDMFGAGWIGQSDNFNMGALCTAIKPGGNMAGIMPALVSYIIAFAARRDQGLQDCNVDGNTNLCKFGATYLRAHLEDRIIPIYSNWAKGFAASCGTTTPILWLMEPDYYQYVTGGDAKALTPTEAGQIMGRLVATVRQSLPNAVFSLDISPWIPNHGKEWYANFNMNDFAFINTSGGGTDASSPKIRQTDGMTWAGVHQVTGKPIIADTGYGVAGSPTGHDPRWDIAANLNARIADGVVGITQYNPAANWTSTITQIRPQLAPIPCQ